MERCKNQAVCKHYEAEIRQEVIKEPESPKTKYCCKKCDFTCDDKGIFLYHYRSQHPGRITKTLQDKPSATVRHCKKCDFTTSSQGVLCQHYRHEHPKTKPAERIFKDRGGKNTKAMGLDSGKGNLESTTGLKINKDKDVRHAFFILQTRSNDCTLSRAAQKDFDKLEDQTADSPLVATWPTDVRRKVISLYNEVVNGVLEEK